MHARARATASIRADAFATFASTTRARGAIRIDPSAPTASRVSPRERRSPGPGGSDVVTSPNVGHASRTVLLVCDVAGSLRAKARGDAREDDGGRCARAARSRATTRGVTDGARRRFGLIGHTDDSFIGAHRRATGAVTRRRDDARGRARTRYVSIASRARACACAASRARRGLLLKEHARGRELSIDRFDTRERGRRARWDRRRMRAMRRCRRWRYAP
jgi:hypothetical protein